MTTSPVQKCLVVVPMKDPTLSKTRLRGRLKDEQRKALAQLLFKRTLKTLLQARDSSQPALFDLAVVTDSTDAATIATAHHVTVIEEGPAHSLSRAVDTAAQWAAGNGYDAICMFPADLAAPDPEDIRRFVQAGLQHGGGLLCPSTDMGTNALFLSPPTAITFSFGINSANSHLTAIEQAGLLPRLLPLESLRFDIDTVDCLEKSLGQVPEVSNLLAQT